MATICTEEFESLGRLQVKMLGRPDLPIVKVPHPVGGMPEATIEGYADEAVERVVAVLTGASKERAVSP
ncbi:MAG: hypothetical protein HYX92_17925 [Chloroflexi bacterium]|nr:hypothetical protein [Chloroflexota bacterium]